MGTFIVAKDRAGFGCARVRVHASAARAAKQLAFEQIRVFDSPRMASVSIGVYLSFCCGIYFGRDDRRVNLVVYVAVNTVNAGVFLAA